MKQFSYVITDEIGLHARPAGVLAKEVKKYASKIELSKDGKTVEAKRLMAVMAMGIKCGETVEVKIEGPDEDIAFEELKNFFENNI